MIARGLALGVILSAALSPPPAGAASAASKPIALITIKEVVHTAERLKLPGIPGAYFADPVAGEVLYFRPQEAPGPETSLLIGRTVALASPGGGGTLSVESFRFAAGRGDAPLKFARRAAFVLDPATGACTMTIEDRTFILKPGAGSVHIKDDRFDPPIKVDGHDVSRYGLIVRNEGSFPIEAFKPTELDRSGRFP